MDTSDIRRPLESLGFVTLHEVLTEPSLTSLRHRMNVLLGDCEGLWCSTAVEERLTSGIRQWCSELVERLVGPTIVAAFPGMRVAFGSCFCKGSGAPEVPFHQDLTYTPEPSVRSYVAWIPLVDVNARNGALKIVPESHLWTSGIRSMGPGGVHPLTDVKAELECRSVTLEMKAGDAVIFDVAAAHGSHANSSTDPRPNLAVNLIPIDSEPVIYYADHLGRYEEFLLPENYLSTPRPFFDRPAGASRDIRHDVPMMVLPGTGSAERCVR